jgi:hypothetical protein
MKWLKFGIALLGVVGVIGCFLPAIGEPGKQYSLYDLRVIDEVHAYLMIAGLALAAIMGGLAIARPPLERWQAGIALAGFALTAIKFRFWDGLQHFGEYALGGQLVLIVPLLGIAIAAIGAFRAQEA